MHLSSPVIVFPYCLKNQTTFRAAFVTNQKIPPRQDVGYLCHMIKARRHSEKCNFWQREKPLEFFAKGMGNGDTPANFFE